MIDESFKVGISLEVEQSSLESITTQFKQALNTALAQAASGIKPSRQALTQALPSPATVRSASVATGVSGNEVAKAVAAALKAELSPLAQAIQKLAAAVDKNSSKAAETAKVVKAAAPVQAAAPIKSFYNLPTLADFRARQAGAAVPVTSRPAPPVAATPPLSPPVKRETSKEKNVREMREKAAEAELKVARNRIAAAEAEQAVIKSTLSKPAPAVIAPAPKAVVPPKPAAPRYPSPQYDVANQSTQVYKYPTEVQDPAGYAETRKMLADRAKGIRTRQPQRYAPNEQRDVVYNYENEIKRKSSSSTTSSMAQAIKNLNVSQGRGAAIPPIPSSLPPGGRLPPSLGASHTEIAGTIEAIKTALKTALGSTVSGKGIYNKLNLPAISEDPGLRGAPGISSGAGIVRVVTRDIEVFGGKVVKVANKLEGILTELNRVKPGKDERSVLQRAAEGGVFRPAQAVSQLQKVINTVVAELPAHEENKGMASTEKSGEATVHFKPTEEQFEHLKKLEEERLQIIQVVRWLGELNSKLKELGVETATLVGLSEGSVGKAKFPKITDEMKASEYKAELPVQTIPFAGAGHLGSGAINPARSFQPTQVREMLEGTAPRVMGTRERSLMESGNISSKQGRELRTAFVDMPDVTEDMILILKSAAKNMSILKTETLVLKEVTEGVVEGMTLTHKQFMGKGFKDEDVAFDLKGTAAKVKSISKRIEDGIDVLAVTVEQTMPMTTGSKVNTRGGIKGVVRLEENLGKDKRGRPIEAVLGQRGAMKRQSIRDFSEAMTNEMADAAKVSSAKVAEMMEHAMVKAGMSLSQAIESVSKELGLKGFTGMSTVKGGVLGRGAPEGRSIMVGGVHIGSLGEGKEKGMLMQEKRFISSSDRASLVTAYGAESAMARQLDTQHKKLIATYSDLITELRALDGSLDVTKEGLKEVLPGEIAPLPHGTQPPEAYAGTLLDAEKYKKAFTMPLRSPTGTTEQFRVPAIGTPGGRDKFEKDTTGAIGVGKLTRELEHLRVAAAHLSLTLDGLDTTSKESLDEATHQINQAVNAQVASIRKLAQTNPTEAGTQAKVFNEKMMSLVHGEGSTASLQYKFKGKVTNYPEKTAESYINKNEDPMHRMLRLRDVLVKRPGQDKPIGGYQALASTGQLFDPETPNRVARLQKALKLFGVELSGDTEKIAAAYKAQQAARESYIKKLLQTAVEGPGTGNARSLSAAKQGSTSISPYGSVVSYPAERMEGLAAAETELKKLGAAGQDVGESLSLIGEARAIQPEKTMKRGEIGMHTGDVRSWATSVSKETGRGVAEEMKRLLTEDVSTHRYPTTGSASFVSARIKTTEDESLRGKFAVPTVPTLLSKEKEEKMRAPLEAEKARLLNQVRGAGGASSPEVRKNIRDLEVALDGLRSNFAHASQNLDLDGDAIVLHAGLTKEVSAEMSNLRRVLQQDSYSIGGILGRLRDKLEESIVSISPKELDVRMKEVAGAKGRKYAAGELGTTLRPSQGPAEAEASQKLISPKLSTGLATSSYVQLETLTAKTLRGSEHFASGLTHIMLNINQALATKHGGADIKLSDMPAFKFLEHLGKMGGVETIIKGMGKGGEFEKLGKENDALMSKRREFYESMDPAKLSKVVGKPITTGKGGNWKAEIEKQVQKESFPTFLHKIQEVLIQESIKALQRGKSMSQTDAEKEVRRQMSGPRGLNLNAAESILHPDVYATRKRGVRASEALPLEARLRKTVERLPNDTFQFSDEGGDAAASKIAKSLHAGLTKYINSFKDKIRVHTLADFEAQFPQMAGQGPAPLGITKKTKQGGAISLSAEGILAPIEKVFAQLEQMGRGELAATPELLNEMSAAIMKLTGTLTHENLHALMNKGAIEPLEELKLILRDSSTPGVRELRSRLDEKRIVKAKAAGVGLMRDALQAGEETVALTPGSKAKTKVSAKALKKLNDIYIDSMAQEALAPAAQKPQLDKLLKGLPDALQDAIRRMGTELLGLLPEAEKEIYNFGTQLSSSVLQGLTASVGASPAAARKAAQTRVAARMVHAIPPQYPGKERLDEILERGNTMERAVTLGREEHRLTRGRELKGGKLGTEEPQLVRGADRGDQMLALLKQAQGAVPGKSPYGSPRTYSAFKEQVTKERRVYSAALEQLPKSQGVSPYLELAKLDKEFQAARLTYLLNERRVLVKAIQTLQSEGKTGSTEFQVAINELEAKTDQIISEASSTLARSGKGTGRINSIIASNKGIPNVEARAAGVQPRPGSASAIISEVGGRGAEGAQFKGMAGMLEKVVNEVVAGKDATAQWGIILAELEKHPEQFATHLAKVLVIMRKLTGLAETLDGEASGTAVGFKNIADSAAVLGRQLPKFGAVTSTADIAALKASTKSTRAVSAKTVEDPIAAFREQSRAFEARAKEAAIERTQVHKATGQTKFEPISGQIISPKTGETLQKLQAAFKFDRASGAFVAHMTQAGIATDNFGNKLKNALMRVGQWGMATGIVYGAVRVFQNLVTTITEVQTGMTELKKVMDTSITNFEKMQDAAVGMAKDFGAPITEVIKGMEVYAQQGLKTAEIMERTNSTMMAVNVTTLTSEEATNALTAASKQFGDEISTSMTFVDSWGAVAAKHAVTAKDLAQAMNRTGTAASSAGVGFHDFMGIVTAIGSVTRKTGTEVGTAMRFMFKQFGSAKAQKALGEVGVSTINQAGELRPAMDVLSQMAGKWDSLGRSQKLTIAQAMAGTRHYNDFIVLMNNFGEATEASEHSLNAQGFAAKKNALAMQTAAKQIEVLKQTFAGLGLAVGKSMLPAGTAVIKTLSGIANAVSSLPEIFLQVLAVGGTAFIGINKLGWIAMNTFRDIGGVASEAGPKLGKFSSILKSIVMAPVSAGRGLFGGLSKVGDVGAGLQGAGLLTQVLNKPAKSIRTFIADVQGAAAVNAKFGNSLTGVARATEVAQAAWMAFGKTIMITGGIGVAIAGIAYLISKYNELNRTGKEVESSLEDQIGQSQDLASQYSAQAASVASLATAYKKYEAASSDLESGDIADQLKAGTFKSPIKEAQAYGNTFQKIALAAAKMDPGNIEGISETGDLLMHIDDGLKGVAKSAADAQRAISSALQIKVLSAYSDELTKAKGVWNIIKSLPNTLFGAGKEFSLLGDLKDARAEANKLLDKKKELAESGLPALGIQTEINNAVNKELDLRGQALEIGLQMKRVLEEMPTLSDTSLTADILSGSKLTTGIKAGAETGAFGRGASTGSVEFKQMAKSFGYGGMFDYTSGSSPALVSQAMTNRGVLPSAPTEGAKVGDIGVITREAAVSLLDLSTVIKDFGEAPKSTQEAIESARSGFVDLDHETGELVYRFFDSVSNTWKTASMDAGSTVMKGLMGIFEKGKIQDEMEKTQKLLTTQFVGALAGMHIPLGAVNIGAARMRDVAPEERMKSDLPVQMERLSKLQAEMGEAQKKYNEDLEAGDPSETFKEMAGSGRQLKIMLEADREAFKGLMKEGFELSVIGQYKRAMIDLNDAMLKVTDAMKDAAVEEQTRLETMKHTSGALAGQPEMATLSFGKRTRELSGLERLQPQVPGMAQSVSSLSIADKQRSVQVQGLTDLRKQRRAIEEMATDLAAAGETLDKSSAKTVLERAQKVDKPTAELARTIEKSSMTQYNVLNKQVSLQERMLEELKLANDVAAKPEAERAGFIKQEVGKRDVTDLMSMVGKTMGPANFNRFFNEKMGIVSDVGVQSNVSGEGHPTVKKSQFGGPTGLTPAEQEQLDDHIAEIIKLTNEAADLGTGTLSESLYSKSRTGEIQTQIQKETEGAYKIPGVTKYLQKEVANIAATPQGKADEEDKKKLEIESNRAIINKQATELYMQLASKEKELLTGIKASTDALSPVALYMQADTVSEFANKIEEVINGFKQIQELDPNKLKESILAAGEHFSDLEGPFARVGQPGFRTQFENKRLDLDKEYDTGRPHSMEEMRAHDKAKKQIDFDEEEAKITEKQAVQTSKLKDQQGQAEQLKSMMIEMVRSGDLKGTDSEKLAKDYAESLGKELVTSEKATNVGGELKFQGIPSLEEAQGLANKLKEAAKDTALKAKIATDKAVYTQAITAPLQTSLAGVGENINSLAEVMAQSRDYLAVMAKKAETSPPGFGAGEQAPLLGAGGPKPEDWGATAAGATRGYKSAEVAARAQELRDQDPNLAGKPYSAGFNVGTSRTNMNLAKEADARATFGNATASPSSIVTTKDAGGQLNAAGSTRQADATLNAPTTTPTAVAPDTQALTQALAQISGLLSTLTSQGVKIPETLTQSITSVGEAMSTAFDKNLKVEVTNPSLTVSVSNLSEVTGALSGLSGVGAEVADIRLKLTEVETQVQPGGIRDKILFEKVDAAVAESKQTTDALTTQVTALEAKVPDPVEIQSVIERVASLDDSVTTLTSTVDKATTEVSTVSTTVIQNTEAITALTETLSTFDSELNDVIIRTASQGDKVDTLETGLADTQKQVDALVSDITTANTDASKALAATEAFPNMLEERGQKIDQSIRIVETRLASLDTAQEGMTKEISTVRTLATLANARAEQALNRAMGSQSV